MIGGNNPLIVVGADIPVLTSTEMLIDRIAEVIEQGFPRVKLKYNQQKTPNMIEKVCNTYPDFVMHIDCNSGFTLNDIDMFQRIDHFDLSMTEQPLAYDYLIDHSILQKQLKKSICLDESISSIHCAAKAIKANACQWINIKTSRVGGLTTLLLSMICVKLIRFLCGLVACLNQLLDRVFYGDGNNGKCQLSVRHLPQQQVF